MAETGSPSTNHRMKAYKNKALDSQEMRRRREEEGIQLRKQKREEQVCAYDIYLCGEREEGGRGS